MERKKYVQLIETKGKDKISKTFHKIIFLYLSPFINHIYLFNDLLDNWESYMILSTILINDRTLKLNVDF